MRVFVLPVRVLSCLAAAVVAAADEGSQSEATERTVILGGHEIPVTETEGVTPVSVLSLDYSIKQGANTPAEALRQLPAYVGNTETENDANDGDGSAFVNLFALGHENTLVLINGRRAFAFKDINGIPLVAVSRVEVLKGAGAAVNYGSGPGGAVNFILLNGPGDAPFEGAEINLLYGNTTDKDARVLQAWIRGGVATDRAAIAVAAEYYDRDAIFSRDREISASADRRHLGGSNTGSPTFPGRVTAANQPGGAARILIDPSTPPTGAGSYRAYGGPNSDDPLNFRRYTPAIPAMEKYQIYLTGRYKVFGEALQVYGDALYAKRKQDNALAPAPFALVTGGAYRNPAIGIPQNFTSAQSTARQLEIIRQSPFNPFPGNQLMQVSYRAIDELGLRRSFYDYDYYRYVAGLKGEFRPANNSFFSYLGYDAGMVYERGDYLRIDSGDALRGAVLQEVINGRFNPFIGLQTPVAGTAPTFANGIPTGTASYDNAAAFQNSSYVGRTFRYGRDSLADARIFGNLLPNLYQGGIGFNAGYEFRHNRSKTVPDPTQTAGDQLGFIAAPRTSFHQEVNAWFGELQIPVVTAVMDIPGVRSFEVSAAYRYEEADAKDQFSGRAASFANDGDVRVSLRYQPVRDLMLRASYSQASRPPELFDLFEPVTTTFPFIFDPFQPQPSNGVLVGGNPSLQPETTDGYSAGLVIQPSVLPQLTATADFYQLFTRNVILHSSDLSELILQRLDLFPDRVVSPRSDLPFFPGPIQQIDATNGNFGKRLVNGLDVTAAYRLETTTFGTFTLSLGYNHFFTWKAEPVAGFGSINFTGDYDNGTRPLAPGAIPRHKGFLRGEYEWKGFNFVATTNYISSFVDDPAFLNDPEWRPDVRGPDRTVSDYITVDLQLSYEFIKPEIEFSDSGYSKNAKDAATAETHTAAVEQGSSWQRLLWGTSIRVGVVNAFDRNPPTVLGALNDNYDTSLYSVRNRYYYVGISRKF